MTAAGPGGPRRRPILVTGLVRSGTTWVGRVLATARNTVYIHEPFNPDSLWSAAFPVPEQHLYIDDTMAYQIRFRRLLDLDPWFRGAGTSGTDECLRVIAAAMFKFGASRSELRPVVKDPTAVLSVEWLAKSFGMAPVVVLRHPVGVTKSLVRLRWVPPSSNLRRIRSQPRLIERFYADRRDELDKMAETASTAAERAAAMVRFLYLAVADYAETHPDWTYVPYEDLTNEAADRFAHLFERLGLEATDETHELLSADRGVYDESGAHQRDARPIPAVATEILAPTPEESDWPSIMERYFADIEERLAATVRWSTPV